MPSRPKVTVEASCVPSRSSVIVVMIVFAMGGDGTPRKTRRCQQINSNSRLRPQHHGPRPANTRHAKPIHKEHNGKRVPQAPSHRLVTRNTLTRAFQMSATQVCRRTEVEDAVRRAHKAHERLAKGCSAEINRSDCTCSCWSAAQPPSWYQHGRIHATFGRIYEAKRPARSGCLCPPEPGLIDRVYTCRMACRH